MQKVLFAAATVVGLSMSAGAAGAFPLAPIEVARDVNVLQTSFWGRAFPYRYNWSLVRACTRYEPEETSRGTVMRRVWVCGERWRERTGAVVSYRG
jgi:hypothetical protein